jgi:hypothetical protein
VVSRVSCPWVGHTPQQRKDSGKLECIVIQKHLQGVASGDLSSCQERKSPLIMVGNVENEIEIDITSVEESTGRKHVTQ